MKKVALLMFCCVLFLTRIIAQQSVSGKITDELNSPLPGVTIQVVNTNHGTLTDAEGKFTISALPSDSLLISMVGMLPQTLLVGTQLVIQVQLRESVQLLNEVVVVGYGSQRVKDLTAPIVSVKGDDLNRQTTSNPMQALQGKVAGVQIINSGSPGSGSTVKIRGVGSIGDYANPLYVVDGVFVENIDFLGSGDIEDLTILKDASAAAIYGVRAANGVILVTTKKGKTGKPSISYEGYYGYQTPVNMMPMANTAQYVSLMNEANENTIGYVPKVASAYPTSTDWYKELTRNANMTNHSLDISGSNDKTSYSFGGSYLFQEGIMNAKNNYARYNFRTRLEQKVNDYLKIGFNSVLSNYNQYHSNDDAFFSAFVNPPVYPVYDASNADAYPVKYGSPQSYGFGNQYGNPVATAKYEDNYEKGNLLVFSAFVEVSLIANKLTFRSAYNEDMKNWKIRDFQPQYVVGGSQGVRSSSLSSTFGNSSNQIIDNLLTFKAKSGKHDFTVLAGQSTRMEKYETLLGTALNVSGLDDESKYLITGSSNNRNAVDDPHAFYGLSFFSRVNYNYNEKYLATVTFRADGSSKYQQKWGYFPSVGLGWIISDEDFMKNKHLLQYLKVRASWGLLGNDNVPANSAITLGQTGAASSGIFGDKLVTGIGAQTVIQNYLKWEVVNEVDLGVDFALLKNRLSGGIDYYHRKTTNVVLSAPIATGGGTADLLGNNGDVLNTGIELNLTWADKWSTKASYHASMNVTYVHNEVTKLQGRDFIPGALIRGSYTTRTQVGHPIGAFYGYEIAGVYQSEGEALKDPVSQSIKDKGFFKYKDQNGDNVIDEKDKVFLGSPIPWLIAGMDFGVNLGHFDASVSVQGQLGNKILNAKRMNRDVFTDGNYDRDFYDNHWSANHKSTKYPSAEAFNYSYTQQANDFFVENGGYIRLQNIQVGYTTEKIKFISKVRFYISAQRPYTYFSYHGFTPEIGGTPISSGVDNTVYPMQAIYTAGLKLNF